MKIIFILFLVGTFKLMAQGGDTNFVKVAFEYNKMDFFSTVSFGQQHRKSQTEIGLGVGVNRTFFQQRMYPRMQARASYFFVDKSNFRIGGTLSYDFSFLNFNKKYRDIHVYNEGFGGLIFEIGNRYVFQFIPEIGVLTHTYRSSIDKKNVTNYVLQNAAQIGFKYVL